MRPPGLDNSGDVSWPSISTSTTTGVATITINRPERLNAMDAEHYALLSKAWQRVRDDHRPSVSRSSPGRAAGHSRLATI